MSILLVGSSAIIISGAFSQTSKRHKASFILSPPFRHLHFFSQVEALNKKRVRSIFSSCSGFLALQAFNKPYTDCSSSRHKYSWSRYKTFSGVLRHISPLAGCNSPANSFRRVLLRIRSPQQTDKFNGECCHIITLSAYLKVTLY